MTSEEKAREIISIIYTGFRGDNGCFNSRDYNALVSSLEGYIDKIESGEIKSCNLVEKEEMLIKMIRTYLTGKTILSWQYEEHLLDKITKQEKLISELEKKVKNRDKVLKAIIKCINVLEN